MRRDKDIEQLFSTVEPRVDPPPDMRERVYANALSTWESLPEQQPAPQPTTAHWPIALAASVLLGVMVLWVLSPFKAESIGYLVAGNEQGAIFAEDLIQTGRQENAVIELRSGVRIVLAGNTALQVHSQEAASSTQGKLYIDAESGQLRLHTAHARIVDIGTIFQVWVTSDTTEVTMREGAVEIAHADQVATLNTRDGLGDAARVHANGQIDREIQVDTTDALWDWVKSARTPPLLDGLTVSEYIRWMARDSGYSVVYASNTTEQQALMETLGNTSTATADSLPLQRVLETTSFDVEEHQGNVWQVRFRR